MSSASNLAVGDTNEVYDAFVHDRGSNMPTPARIRIASQTADEFRQNGCHFFLCGKAGWTYVVEYSTDLKSWTTLRTVQATAPEVEIPDDSVTEVPWRFYRMRLLR